MLVVLRLRLRLARCLWRRLALMLLFKDGVVAETLTLRFAAVIARWMCLIALNGSMVSSHTYPSLIITALETSSWVICPPHARRAVNKGLTERRRTGSRDDGLRVPYRRRDNAICHWSCPKTTVRQRTNLTPPPTESRLGVPTLESERGEVLKLRPR